MQPTMEAVEQQGLQETEQNDAIVAVFVAVGVRMMDQENKVMVLESWPRKYQWLRDHLCSHPS